jgi:hypothetical protein
MRSKVIKNKGHLIKAWVVWQVNKWTKIWIRTIYTTCLCTTVNIYFHIFHLKWKQIQIIITIFDGNQNLIGYDHNISLFFFESLTSFSRITLWKFILKLYIIMYLYWQDFIFFLLPFTNNSILLKWSKKVCKVKRSSIELFSLYVKCAILGEELITCIIFLFWPWQ